MKDKYQKTKVLITVKTYPHPSKGYVELVCTAGITESGEWVRLYPIDYRYLRNNQQYHKYQWIEVDLLPHGKQGDHRKESRKPDIDTLKIISRPIPTAKNWLERRKIIDSMQHNTLLELEKLYEKDRTSLGIVRPTEVIDLKIIPVDLNWKPKQQAEIDQMRLFGIQRKKLTKLPYKFQFVFLCEDSSKPHNTMIEDWELGTLFLKERQRLGSNEAAAESTKRKFLNEICHEFRDTRFFMGTRFPYNTWLILGVFWPPKIDRIQENLF